MKKSINRFFQIVLVFIFAISLCCCISTNVSVKPLNSDEKVADFEQLCEVIEAGYPYLELNKRVNGVDWLANKEMYLDKVKNTKDDQEFIKVIEESLADLNNGHTHLVSDKGLYDYLKTIYKKTGWYDFWNDKKVKERYASLDQGGFNNNSIESTEDLILKDVKKGEVGYIYLPEMTARGKSIKEDMNDIAKYLNQIKDYEALILDIRGNPGGSDDYWYELMARIIPQAYTVGGYILFRGGTVIENYVSKRGVDTKDIKALSNNVLKNAPAEVKNDFSTYVEFADKLEPKKSINYQGKIFLLTDKSVYSSAESLAIFCRENGIAKVVGETTGGDGGGMDPVLFKLNNSGLIVRMAEDMYLTPAGFCDDETKVVPDYKIENVKRTKEFKDDKCIQKVLDLLK